MADRLKGKVAVITGAARGTGAEMARAFVREGARVWIADVLEDEGQRIADELGEAARFVALDVTSEAAWQEAVAAVTARDGGLHVLVNNAAILRLASFVETSGADFEALMKVNQLGPFLGMQAVFPAMQGHGAGSIINLCSVDGVSVKNGVSAYASTKWGLRGLSKVAAVEFGKYGVRVNTICPEAGGPEMVRPYLPEGVDPELAMSFQWPILASNRDRTIQERLGDIAHLAIFLASDESLSCTGGDFVIDGGHSAGRLLKGGPAT
ncbi:MAG: SDR family NAD(P)-dependent oxidoreductase [Myxococcota bacterium]